MKLYTCSEDDHTGVSLTLDLIRNVNIDPLASYDENAWVAEFISQLDQLAIGATSTYLWSQAGITFKRVE